MERLGGSDGLVEWSQILTERRIAMRYQRRAWKWNEPLALFARGDWSPG